MTPEERNLVIEECAKACDQVRNNCERRAGIHENCEARNSALDKMEGAIQCAHAIRDLAAQPRAVDTANCSRCGLPIGKGPWVNMASGHRTHFRCAIGDPLVGVTLPQPRSNSVEDGAGRNPPQKAVIDTEQSGHIPSHESKGI